MILKTCLEKSSGNVGVPCHPRVIAHGNSLFAHHFHRFRLRFPKEKGVPMKGSKSLVAITIATTLAITPLAIAEPKTTLKAAGRVVATVVNTILSGPAIPTKAIGIDGDFYIDTKNAILYGPKKKGVWKIATSLKQTDTKSVTTVIGEQGDNRI